MKLKEFEGKELFFDYDIPIPSSKLIKKDDSFKKIDFVNKVIKTQILSNGRGKNGGILFSASNEEGIKLTKELFSKKILNEKIEEILIEHKVNILKEFYLGIIFDTKKRVPMFILSKSGGIDIEDVSKEDIKLYEINVLNGVSISKANEITKEFGIKNNQDVFSEILVNLYSCFQKNDMKMVEINPLAQTKDGFIAIDSVVVLDDDALKRHQFTFPKRTGIREKTDREIRANRIDETDYRGVAGRTFIDLDGDIATLSSGGGASITAMDAILSSGGNITNYTEYSGNPSAEKVKKLTKIVLEPKNLSGLFIIGGRANFTRIDITLQAILKILIEKKVKFPILVRRAGPGDKEAFEAFKKARKEHNLWIELYDDSLPISLAAKRMVELSNEFKEKNKR